jgi:hypothetical protein
MVINANTKRTITVLMVPIVAAEYGGIGQISRRKTEVSFRNIGAMSPGTPLVRLCLEGCPVAASAENES